MPDTHEPITPVNYTTDMVAFRDDEVLLIERGWEPFKGCLALPGGYVDSGETAREAAAREAKEETGLVVPAGLLHLVDVYDDPDRDPRGRVVSAAYAIVVDAGTAVRAGDDAARAEWVGIESALRLPMAFDHTYILRDAYALLRHGELDLDLD